MTCPDSFTISCFLACFFFFFFNDPPTTEIYTLSLHDALPILRRLGRLRRRRCIRPSSLWASGTARTPSGTFQALIPRGDRKSTRLNSSHTVISYAVFCLKKKKKKT